MKGKKWWHNAVVYQIYPRSFKDSNSDGIGDIPGIIQKLDYLSGLGINTIWLCPVCASPMVDNGYDISDYRDIHPEFGTLADMEKLFAETAKRGIKVLVDLVLNHSSDEHIWFKNAVEAVLAGDTQNPYRDFYYFRQGKGEIPPNNWRSYFGGSVWEPVGESGYWYLHLFAKGQPDFNWENPRLRGELYDMIRWWIARGAAGFRVDAICNIKKDTRFADLPPDGPDGLANVLPSCLAYPGIEVFLLELRNEVFEPADCFTVAEAAGVKPEKLEAFIGQRGFFSTIFDFSYTDIDIVPNCSYNKRYYFTPRELRDRIFKSQLEVTQHGYGALYLENHDQNRSPDKYLAGAVRCFEGKTLLGLLYFFLQGVPFIYQGQELGMENFPWKDIGEFNDISTRDQYERMLREGLSEKEALALAAYRSRDNARTPMLWDSSFNAGFSAGKPWLPVHPDFPKLNVEVQQSETRSVLNFYKQMIRLRKEHSGLFMYGDFIPRFTETMDIFAYERAWQGKRSLVMCNFCNEKRFLDIPKGKLWLGNCRTQGGVIGGKTTFAPLEALIMEIGE
jgi:glycosidase